MIEEGNYSITYSFENTQEPFSWSFTGVYAPHTRKEKLECWEKLAAMRGLCEGPWVLGGDFNTARRMEERRGCSRSTNVMVDFSSWIEDLELHDPILIGINTLGSGELITPTMLDWIDSCTHQNGRKTLRRSNKELWPE